MEGGNPDEVLKVPFSRLQEHIDYLWQPFNEQIPNINGFDREFNWIEQKTAEQHIYGDYKSAILPVNKNKNRYSNVLPTESTRVKLTPIESEEGSDYINANFINGQIPGSERAYIASQGPLPSTYRDFWRMVWENNASVIVMLTREVENGRLKCDQYWPNDDAPFKFDPFCITLQDVTQFPNEGEPELFIRVLELTKSSQNEHASRKVVQFQYTAWPDHGLPLTTNAFLELLHDVDKENTTKGPIVVHCSAGIGRSGTFCTVHSALEKLKYDLRVLKIQDPYLDLQKVILDLRYQRPGMVQTKEQYEFCYLAIQQAAAEIFNPPAPAINGTSSSKKANSEEDSSEEEDSDSEEEEEEDSDDEEGADAEKRRLVQVNDPAPFCENCCLI